MTIGGMLLRRTMTKDEFPSDIGTLERAAWTNTEDGPALLFETDEGEYLLKTDSNRAIENLAVAVDQWGENYPTSESADYNPPDRK